MVAGAPQGYCCPNIHLFTSENSCKNEITIYLLFLHELFLQYDASYTYICMHVVLSQLFRDPEVHDLLLSLLHTSQHVATFKNSSMTAPTTSTSTPKASQSQPQPVPLVAAKLLCISKTSIGHYHCWKLTSMMHWGVECGWTAKTPK